MIADMRTHSSFHWDLGFFSVTVHLRVDTCVQSLLFCATEKPETFTNHVFNLLPDLWRGRIKCIWFFVQQVPVTPHLWCWILQMSLAPVWKNPNTFKKMNVRNQLNSPWQNGLCYALKLVWPGQVTHVIEVEFIEVHMLCTELLTKDQWGNLDFEYIGHLWSCAEHSSALPLRHPLSGVLISPGRDPSSGCTPRWLCTVKPKIDII